MSPNTQPQKTASPYVGVNTLAALSADAREYVERRWLTEVKWFTAAKRRSRRTYFALSITTLASSSLTALLAGAAVGTPSEPLRWAIALLGLTSAVSTGLLSLFQASLNWKRRSITSERLKSEGNQFFSHAGKYESVPEGRTEFAIFVESIEGIIYAHKNEFFAKDLEVPPDAKAKPAHQGLA